MPIDPADAQNVQSGWYVNLPSADQLQDYAEELFGDLAVIHHVADGALALEWKDDEACEKGMERMRAINSGEGIPHLATANEEELKWLRRHLQNLTSE